MPFAKTCECQYPLTIADEDHCSYCSRYVELPDEQPRVEDEYTPEELARQMYKAGTPVDQIESETGLGEARVLKVCDPALYRVWRNDRTEKERARAEKRATPEELAAKEARRRERERQQEERLRQEQERREREEAVERRREMLLDEMMDKYAHLRVSVRSSHKSRFTSDQVEAVLALRLAEPEGGPWSIANIAQITGVTQEAVRQMRDPDKLRGQIARAREREARLSKKVLAAEERARKPEDFARLKRKYAPLRTSPRGHRQVLLGVANWSSAAKEIASIKSFDGRRRWSLEEIGEILGVGHQTVTKLLGGESDDVKRRRSSRGATANA